MSPGISGLPGVLPPLFAVSCSWCTETLYLEFAPPGIELPGESTWTCTPCRRKYEGAPLSVVPGRSVRLRDGGQLRSARWAVVSSLGDGWHMIRRLGFPEDAPFAMHVTGMLP